MGKPQGSKLSIESKRNVGKTIDQLSSAMRQPSAEGAKRLANQKAGVSLKVESGKRKKTSDPSHVQVIASIISRRCSNQKGKNLKPGQPNPSKISKQAVRKLAGKIVTKTLNGSRPSRSVKLPATSKYQKKDVIPDLGRNGKNQRKVRQAHRNEAENQLARRPRSQGAELIKKVQLKREETEKESRKRRHHKRKKTGDEPKQDHISRINKRVKYLLNRMKVEQNLIDAYSAEGWKGQSREKIRPERELQRANAQIIQFQLGIREAVQQLDMLGLEGSLEASVFDSQGRIYHEDIFCAKCTLQEASADNDIVLCDGFCNRAFHQCCLDPPLRTEDIPPGDEGWLCPVCECKLECLDIVNAYLGTTYRVEDHWQKVFAEAAAAASGNGKPSTAAEDWPSEDSEDDDYNPAQDVNRAGRRAEEEKGSASGDSSGRSLNEEDLGSSSSDEESDVSVFDEFAENSRSELIITDGCEGRNEHAFEDEDDLLVGGKRQRKEVDYKKLHDEMFGKDASAGEASEDEEWGPRKRLKNLKQSEEHSQRGTKVLHEKMKTVADAKDIDSPKSLNAPQSRQSKVRLPPHTVEKLRAVFKENPLPSRACKEGLSRQLGLSFRKVSFWFKNVRYAALKKGLVQRTNSKKKHSTCSTMENGVAPTEKRVERNNSTNGLLLEMERLCEAQLKVERLKRILKDGKSNAVRCEMVMYVAVPELREKAPAS